MPALAVHGYRPRLETGGRRLPGVRDQAQREEDHDSRPVEAALGLVDNPDRHRAAGAAGDVSAASAASTAACPAATPGHYEGTIGNARPLPSSFDIGPTGLAW